MALASANAFAGSVVRSARGSEGLAKACCWRTSWFGHLCSQCSTVCVSSMYNGHVGTAVGSTRWAYALSSCVCPGHKRARRTAFARSEVDIQPVCQSTFLFSVDSWPLSSPERRTVRLSLLRKRRAAQLNVLWTYG